MKSIFSCRFICGLASRTTRSEITFLDALFVGLFHAIFLVDGYRMSDLYRGTLRFSLSAVSAVLSSCFSVLVSIATFVSSLLSIRCGSEFRHFPIFLALVLRFSSIIASFLRKKN